MKINKLALGAALTALVFFATRFLAVATPVGLFHMGDAFILGSAAILGPFAFIPAALGSMLADSFGYAQYIPATLVLKGLLGLLAGFLLQRMHKAIYIALCFLTLECVLVVGGYYLYEIILYNADIAAFHLVFNAAQALVGTMGGLLFATQLRRLPWLRQR